MDTTNGEASADVPEPEELSLEQIKDMIGGKTLLLSDIPKKTTWYACRKIFKGGRAQTEAPRPAFIGSRTEPKGGVSFILETTDKRSASIRFLKPNENCIVRLAQEKMYIILRGTVYELTPLPGKPGFEPMESSNTSVTNIGGAVRGALSRIFPWLRKKD